MTRILGSIRNLHEARLLFQTPVDLLDLKNPSRGVLGAVDLATARQIVHFVQGRRHVSAAAGSADDEDVLENAHKLSLEKIDFVKVGFSSAAQQPLLPQLRRAITVPVGAVAVLFADSAELDPMQWIEPACAAGFTGLMLDTADKCSGSLDQHVSLSQAKNWTQATRESGLLCGLAGRLNVESARRFLHANPDYIGFRGALCGRTIRTESICLKTTQALLNALAECSANLESFPSHSASTLSPTTSPESAC